MMSATLIVVLVAALVGGGCCYPGGAPVKACLQMFPVGHHVDAHTTPAPYQISVSSASYAPNQEITVTLDAEIDYYEGVFIQARRARCDDTQVHGEAVGTFRLVNSNATTYLKLMDCGHGKMNAVTHSNTFKKTRLTFIWTAPAQTEGTIYFRGTFVRETEEFWTDVASDFLTAQSAADPAAQVCPVIQFQHQLVTKSSSTSLTAASFFTITTVGLTWLFNRY